MDESSPSKHKIGTPAEDEVNSPSSEPYITASSGTPNEEFVDCISHSVRNLESEFNAPRSSVSETEGSDDSPPTAASMLINTEDNMQIFELDLYYDDGDDTSHGDQSPSEIPFLAAAGAHVEDDTDRIAVSVSSGDSRTDESLSKELDICFVENDNSCRAESIFWKVRNETLTVEEMDSVRNETIKENENEIRKIMQKRMDRLDDIWEYRDVEEKSENSTSPTASEELVEMELTGNGSPDEVDASNSSVELPEEEVPFTRSSTMHRLLLSPPAKTTDTSTKIPLLSEEFLEVLAVKHVFKVLVNGNSGSGKTSVIQYFIHHFFREDIVSNRSLDMYVQMVNWSESVVLQLNIWDIPADREMDSLKCKDAYGSLIVHDVVRSDNINCIRKWKKFIDKNLLLPNGDSIPCVLLVNKIDIHEEGGDDRLIAIHNLCESLKFSAWYATSARDGNNIERAFNFLTTQMFQNKTTYSNCETSAPFFQRRRKVKDLGLLCQNCSVI